MKKLGKNFVGSLLLCLLFVSTAQAAELIPLGVPVGVRMTAEGVVISSLSTVDSAAGEICPGQQAGLEAGDILQTANEVAISSSEQLAQVIQDSGGEPVRITGMRGDTEIETTVQPVQSSQSGMYQIGLLIRDSMAGIGTLTFADPETGAFGALGHPVSDVDSGALLPLETGSIVPASVVGVVAGEAGTPGELVGTYEFSKELGQLNDNTTCGIFGTLSDDSLYQAGGVMQTAGMDEIHTGKAEILTCISGSVPQTYEISIEKITPDAQDSRDLSIRITDAALLEQTGGIVPGMSGSPILQDGKLVGAVTHTLLNNPEKGYGISIETMLKAAA
ncbi:MAG: SpoIVB peptidase [Eubacteriales bacterium]|nr:SpoIVB peptidase [Eubacteriales bacterium]